MADAILAVWWRRPLTTPSGAFLDRLARLLESESPRAYRLFGCLVAAIFIVISGDLIILGAAPIAAPWDVMCMLDGAWRMVSGQILYTDVHNPVGPLTYLLIAFGLKVAPPSVASICYGTVLLLAALVPWAWWIARPRLPAVLAFLFALFIGMLLVAPRPLGYGIRETSYAMIYNRDGYALLSMFLLEIFLERRGPRTGSAFLRGLSPGLLLALMLYCKVTYFVVATASVPLALLLYRRGWAWMVAQLASIVAVGLALFVLYRLSTLAYLTDVAAAGHVQSSAMRVHLLLADLRAESLWSYLVLLFAALWAWCARGHSPTAARSAPWRVAIWVILAGLVCQTGNAAQHGDDPLYVTAALLLVELYRRRDPVAVATAGSPSRLLYATSLLVMLPLFAGSILVADIASLGYATLWNLREAPHFDPSRLLHSERLRDFRVPAAASHVTSYWLASDHPGNINDGIDLLRMNLQSGDRVTTIAFANPFSFALGLQPARDANIFWDLGFSFDESHAPKASEFLGDASLIMVPRLVDRSRGWNFDSADALMRLYGGYLRSNFILIDTSREWLLYRRRDGRALGC